MGKTIKYLKNISLCLLSLLCIPFWAGCFSVTSRERKKLFEYYSEDSVYVNVFGTIRFCHFDDFGGAWWSIRFDEMYVEDLGEDIKRWGGYDSDGKVGGGFNIVPQNQEILIANSFYDLFSELNVDGFTECVLDSTIEIISVPRIWWDGWSYPIVQVKVDNEVYLDFNTGKSNFLNWIQNDLK